MFKFLCTGAPLYASYSLDGGGGGEGGEWGGENKKGGGVGVGVEEGPNWVFKLH